MITEQNYFAINNKILSQSKIKLYDLCPNYMYRTYISGEYIRPSNKNFLIGGEVDSVLTEIDNSKRTVVLDGDMRLKVNREEKKKLEEEGQTVVSSAEYEKIMAVAIAVQSTSIWKDIEKDYVMQEILIMPNDTLGEHFNAIGGKPDAYKIVGNKCYLLDLKTSMTVDKKSFFYKAKDLGYFKQLWMYRELLKFKYPQIKEFDYKFVVVEKSEPYRVVLFNINEKLVQDCEEDMFESISRISKDKEFKKADVRWKDAIELSDPYEPQLEVVEGGWTKI